MIKIEYNQIIEELCEKIVKNNLRYKNTVVMGDNSAGKTDLLKAITVNENRCLFIDCPYDKHLIKGTGSEFDIILIDNIETVLSYKEILDINSFLKNKFGNKKLVIVTHNIELIAQLRDFNIISMYRDCYEINDGNDFITSNDVRGIIESDKSANDIILTNLLTLKLCNKWTQVEEYRLDEIKKEPLTQCQRIILSEICSIK